MEIKETKKGNVVILSLNGRLDSVTAKGLEEKLLPLIESQEIFFAINSQDLTYISSGGLRVLLMGAKKLQSVQGKIVLFSMKDYIKDVFEISGFLSIFPIVDNEIQALQCLQDS